MSAEPIDEDLKELLRLDGPGPARRQPAAAEAALIGAALDAWQAAPPLAPAPSAASAVPWAKVAVIAAAIGGLTGAAVTAALLWGSPDAHEAPATPREAPAPLPAEASPVEAAPVETAPEEATAPTGVEDAPPPTRPRPDARPDARPEDLIALGNRLRAERRWREAEQAYLSAARARPRSATSHIADVAAAAIRLEHRRDPAGAVTLYRRALAARPDGPLALEAREGIARAERHRGRDAAERAALEAIVAHHGGTAAAARARARLNELVE